MTVQVKICGINTIDSAISSLESGADFIGFNFSTESKRRVDLKKAVEIQNKLQKQNNNSLSIVGLFYKNSIEEIQQTIKEIQFDFVQFIAHDETLNWNIVQSLRLNIIPQISVKSLITDEDLKSYKSDLIILDSYKLGVGGGSGNTFEWENAKAIKRKYLLAGGLNPSNVQNAISVLQPFGVDVASGVESSPGVKEPKLIEEFIKNAKRN